MAGNYAKAIPKVENTPYVVVKKAAVIMDLAEIVVATGNVETTNNSAKGSPAVLCCRRGTRQ